MEQNSYEKQAWVYLQGVAQKIHSEQDLKELKAAVAQFFRGKLSRLEEALWEDGTVTEEKMAEWRSQHFRIPYR